jgi:hypothetical protein
MAIISNLTVDQGSTFRATVDITDSDGNPLNLTGYTSAGQIRKSYYSLTAIDFTTNIINETSGVIEISLTSEQTDAMRSGRYVYDIEITSAGGEITRVLEGQVEVTPGVTR